MLGEPSWPADSATDWLLYEAVRLLLCVAMFPCEWGRLVTTTMLNPQAYCQGVRENREASWEGGGGGGCNARVRSRATPPYTRPHTLSHAVRTARLAGHESPPTSAPSAASLDARRNARCVTKRQTPGLVPDACIDLRELLSKLDRGSQDNIQKRGIR